MLMAGYPILSPPLRKGGNKKLWTATALFDQDKNWSLVRRSHPSRQNTREGCAQVSLIRVQVGWEDGRFRVLMLRKTSSGSSLTESELHQIRASVPLAPWIEGLVPC